MWELWQILLLFGATRTNYLRKLDVSEESPDIESLQDALKIFSPFRDDDGVTLGAIDFECPDCDAVFSSSYAISIPLDNS